MTIREFKKMLLIHNVSDEAEMQIPLNLPYSDIHGNVDLIMYEPKEGIITLANADREKPAFVILKNEEKNK